MSEWSLVVFTMAIQLAGGIAIAVTLFDRTPALPDAVMRPLGVAIFPLATFGLLASFFHLGRPWAAWKSLLNLGSSRLSLEVLLTALFVAAALLYSHAWWAQRTDHRLVLGVLTSVLAVGAVASSSGIYLLPSQPAWNSAWVPLSFFGTTILLGGCALSAFADLQSSRPLLEYSLLGTAVGGLMLIAAAAWMISTASHSSPDEFAAAQLQHAMQILISRYPAWFGIHLLLAGIAPLVFAALLWFIPRDAVPPALFRILMFAAVTCGAAIGRKLMYMVVPSSPGF